jgi:glycosyltransferase involved in cell wall biosynthesis
MDTPTWNETLQFPQKLLDQTQQYQPVDIAVGVLCKNVETTVLNVLNVINEGLYRYFPDYKKAIIICDGGSTDKTVEVIDLFQPYNSVEKIVTHDVTSGGKGAGVRTVLEIAHTIKAKCVVLMDGDLLSIKPGWVETISNPIIYGRADLTVPYYIRDKYDGVITNNLVYPFTRAVYGIDIRQPIAGEFALSQNLIEILREHPLFPPDFGVDIFIVTVAAAEGMEVKESLFSLKIHESTNRYLEPEKFLIPMFRKVTGCMFELAEYYEPVWRDTQCEPTKQYHRECFSQKPIPVKIHMDRLRTSVKNEYITNLEYIKKILPHDLWFELNQIIMTEASINPELWAEIVYNYAAAYKNTNSEVPSDLIINTLKILWMGRFVSYAKETKTMDINGAEQIIQKQAEVFEGKFDYLRSIY